MTPSPAAVLELRGISQRFGKVIALDGANLRVIEGTIHAVLGENGAGKTTLMRVAYGLVKPTEGDVFVQGERVDFDSPADGIAVGIGMVQQHPTNVAALRIWENVVLGGSGRLAANDARKNVSQLIASLRMNLDADAIVGDLSVASQQRLEILKAIHRNARVLILDEPTAILAPDEARDLYSWLRAFADGGGTAVVVTHKLTEAQKYTDALTVLRKGRTVLDCASGAASTDRLTMAMLGESLTAPSRGQRSAPAGSVVFRADGINVRDGRGMTVVRSATVEVRANEIVGIAGVEGSGHHEFLLAIVGRHDIAGGAIQRPPRIAFIPEDRHVDAIVPEFSLAENGALKDAGVRTGRMQWTRLHAIAGNLMDRFDVRAPGPSVSMRTLSGGNQQKFVLARELESEPQLIVAENPTRGLDIRAAAYVRDRLVEARSKGVAVVIYSSDLDELLEVADRVLVFHAGSVSAPPLDRDRIGAAMLGAA